jgi:hypothetical protein
MQNVVFKVRTLPNEPVLASVSPISKKKGSYCRQLEGIVARDFLVGAFLHE